jgi:hypothetical protein
MPRVTAPVTTVYLADQLSTVLDFVQRFFVDTTPPHRVFRIRTLLNSCIQHLREPDKFPHNDMLHFLEVSLNQIRGVDGHNPRLKDQPGYQHAYEASLNTLTQVTQLAILHNLLTELEDDDP